ncbi:MAG: PAS domain-containing protein [Nitrospira sp.]|nr:MAG: PAS domain-containing protein [Nitrospira sp.]
MSGPGAATGYQTELLAHAFRRFDQAAVSLQESYKGLMERMERMDVELAAKNEALRAGLREKEDMRSHLAAVLESLTTGVVVIDQRGVIVRCNEAAERLIGRARRDLVGQALSTVPGLEAPGADLPAVMHLSGSPVSVTRTALRNEKGRPHGSILLLNDLSNIRKLEERLQRRDRLAAMGEMVGRIAHEIRNPLGSVELFASMLRSDLAEEPQGRAYTEHISSAVQAMDRLLSNLLLYTRPMSPSPDWHPAVTLVRDSLVLAAHATVGLSIDVCNRTAEEVPMLWCDAAQVRQVLLNLVLNAAQATPVGGAVTVTITEERGSNGRPAGMRMVVADTGSGIDSTLLPRIFDPFFTTREEGTGLGLAIVHAVVEGHHGRVEVDSHVGQGSTFSIVLPQGPQTDRAAGVLRR